MRGQRSPCPAAVPVPFLGATEALSRLSVWTIWGRQNVPTQAGQPGACTGSQQDQVTQWERKGRHPSCPPPRVVQRRDGPPVAGLQPLGLTSVMAAAWQPLRQAPSSKHWSRDLMTGQLTSQVHTGQRQQKVMAPTSTWTWSYRPFILPSLAE